MLQCCTWLQSQSSPSAVLRRRVLARRAVRHAITAGVTRLSRCSAARVQSQSSASAFLRHRARSMPAAPRFLAGVHRCLRCCAASQSFSTAAGLPRRRFRWLAAIWALAGCPLLDSSATISRAQHGVAAMSHLITRVAIDVHSAARARVTQLSSRRFPISER